MTGFTFNARGFAWRLHCADGAIEASLRSEVGRLAAARAFVVSSPSIASQTSTVARVERALADAHAGTFAGIENDSTFRSVEAATAAARDAGADLIVAVGGGSVIVAARAVDIFLCEAGRPFDLMTQYPEGGRAVQPSAERAEAADHQHRHHAHVGDEPRRDGPEESRPQPAHGVLRPEDAAGQHHLGLAGTDGHAVVGPAVHGDHDVHRVVVLDPDRRAEPAGQRGPPAGVCVRPRRVRPAGQQPGRDRPAAGSVRSGLLGQSRRGRPRRADDPGGGSGGFSTGDYAVSTAIHVRYPWVGQGEATSALLATSIRRSPTAPLEFVRRGAEALECWRDGMSAAEGQEAIARALEDLLRAMGMPTRVSQLQFPRADIPVIAGETVKNFNANPGARSEDERTAASVALMEAAW